MGKRPHHDADGAARKRPKVVHDAPTSEEVHTAGQLRRLLTFDQDVRTARHGLQSFKNLLDGIVNAADAAESRPPKLELVVEYLNSVKPKDRDVEEPVYLSDIVETWSMASRINSENLMSAAAVVLALLLKVLSDQVNLVSHGLGICRTLLQKPQQDLLARNLSADKGKDFVTSPTLRLLREMVCFDGGALAIRVFRARSNTFKALARNMSLRYLGEGVEDPNRPSVRTNAVRLVLSSLKFLHAEAKKELLSQRDVVAALMRNLRDDPPSLILDILDTLRTCVVLDRKLSKDVKTKLLSSSSLTRIASLYGYGRDVSSEDQGRTVEDCAHQFLLVACTSSTAGILRTSQGYYPEGVEPDVLLGSLSDEYADDSLDSISWMNAFDNEVPVRNELVSQFIQNLRPWSNAKHSELLVAIFRAAPELVAHYFLQKRLFTFEPKLSATWTGYAAFLFSTMQLPIPRYFGHPNHYALYPPPPSIVLGNILPLPLNPKVLSRCLTMPSKLVSFFGFRFLIAALRKLSGAVDLYSEVSTSSDSLWSEAARRLADEFTRRIPNMREITAAYRQLSEGDLLQREAASRLLLMYHEVVPDVALRAKFDVSVQLLASLKGLESSDTEADETGLRLLELEHLMTIASYSPGMRWFHRAGELSTSPFTSLLRLYVQNRPGPTMGKLENVLHFVAEEYQLVEGNLKPRGLEPLAQALRDSKGIDSRIWGFLDNCAERCARSPIKYLDMIYNQLPRRSSEADEEAAEQPFTPFIMTLAEQLPYFVASSPGEKTLRRLTELLSHYLGYSRDAGVGLSFLDVIYDQFSSALKGVKACRNLSIPQGLKLPRGSSPSPDSGIAVKEHPATTDAGGGVMSREELEELLGVPFQSAKDNSALLKWTSKTAEELVEDGYLASLIWLLSSPHPSIRREALTNVTKAAARIQDSAYDEREQVWLLLMELIETARASFSSSSPPFPPLPGPILAFAARALDILRNPLHPLYGKANGFLCAGPAWALDRVPLAGRVLADAPDRDAAYYAELAFLLPYLVDCLQAPADVDVFRRRGLFERLLALPANPYLGAPLRAHVLRLLYRATAVPGGSTTLITRAGVVAWLAAQAAGPDAAAAAPSPLGPAAYRALIRRAWETCDQERVEAWSRGGVREAVEELGG